MAKHNATRPPAKVLLVDGYNVLRSGSRYQYLALAGPDYSSDVFNAAREALLNDVASFAAREFAATVVFDGGDNLSSRGEPQDFGGVSYLFSPSGTSADTVIEELAHRAVGEGRVVTVVSSDATLQWTVFGSKVMRMSAEDFSWEMAQLSAATQSRSLPDRAVGQPPAPARKNTLGSLLDPQTRATLERLARGE